VPIPVASSVQHRHRGQHRVILIQAGHRLAQIDRHPAGDARGDPQHPPLTATARQNPRFQRAGRRLEVDRRQHGAASDFLAEFHSYFQEILTVKPRAVADQQINRSLRGEKAFRPCSQRCREVIEARSKAGSPSTASTMIIF
jgi:hypothetical protein